MAGAAASEGVIEQGHRALARSDWEAAEACFRRALAEYESAHAHEGLSWAAWYRDEAEAAIVAREAAYRLYRRAGDRPGAARMAIWSAVDYLEFRGAIAVAGGWLSRAERLLDGLQPVPEHGWLHLHRGAIALELEGDLEAACTHADEAMRIGREVENAAVELIALALRGLAEVAAGEVAKGMPRLDEAAAAALSGELGSPVSAGWARCYVISGCEFVRDTQSAPFVRGIRELVIGTGGPKPNSEVRNSDTYGVLRLTLSPTGYDWDFAPAVGSFTDSGSSACH